MMTALQRIRQEQEELAERPGSGTSTVWKEDQRRWLRLQREVLAIVRGEKCEEHAFEACLICKPKTAPPREDVGDLFRSAVTNRDPGDENDYVKPPEDGSREQELQKHLFSELPPCPRGFAGRTCRYVEGLDRKDWCVSCWRQDGMERLENEG